MARNEPTTTISLIMNDLVYDHELQRGRHEEGKRHKRHFTEAFKTARVDEKKKSYASREGAHRYWSKLIRSAPFVFSR